MTKDIIHDSVKNALIKDGWTITADPFPIKYAEFELFADLAAERSPIAAEKDGEKVVIEIKTFAGPSFVRDLQQALGQYQIYLGLLEIVAPERILYLAVSSFIYNDLFTRKAAQVILQRYNLKLLVVNVREEKIVQWKK